MDDRLVVVLVVVVVAGATDITRTRVCGGRATPPLRPTSPVSPTSALEAKSAGVPPSATARGVKVLAMLHAAKAASKTFFPPKT